MSKQPENDNEAREELAKVIVELSNEELEELAGGSSFRGAGHDHGENFCRWN
jgi:hypothetical protein